MYINLTGIKLYGFHGVAPQENLVGAYFYIDLKIKTDFSTAAETDILAGTISYADIFNVVKECMQKPCLLLEHVAYRISKELFIHFDNVDEIEIKVHKENPPMGAESSQVGIEAHYCR